MHEDSAARFVDRRNRGSGDDAILKFRSGGRSSDDVVGFRHELIIRRAPDWNRVAAYPRRLPALKSNRVRTIP